MSQLVARCRSSRIRHELQPWLATSAQQMRRISPMGSSHLPGIVIFGVPGEGKKRLMRALAGIIENPCEKSARELEVQIATKYYTARARCCVVDIDEGTTASNMSDSLRSAHVIILVWSE